jgi:hypothetical protein
VQLYGTGEYARMSYALIYDIQASLALPVLDPADATRCLAVLELVFTTAPVACFATEADMLCKALQVIHPSLSTARFFLLHLKKCLAS